MPLTQQERRVPGSVIIHAGRDLVASRRDYDDPPALIPRLDAPMPCERSADTPYQRARRAEVEADRRIEAASAPGVPKFRRKRRPTLRALETLRQ